MKHLHWLVLNDGAADRIIADDIDASEEAAVIDRVLIPITLGEVGKPAGLNSGYIAAGEIGGKSAVVSLFDEGAKIADVTVCLHSRASKTAWTRIVAANRGALVVDENYPPPQAPWCAVRCFAPESALPAWFDTWTKTLAFALLRREGW